MRASDTSVEYEGLTKRCTASSATLVDEDVPQTDECDVQVNLLSRRAGQPWLAQVAKDLTTREGGDKLSSEVVAETIDGASDPLRSASESVE